MTQEEIQERNKQIALMLGAIDYKAEGMYSQEEVKRIAFAAMDYKNENTITFSEKLKWFEQFKKK